MRSTTAINFHRDETLINWQTAINLDSRERCATSRRDVRFIPLESDAFLSDCQNWKKNNRYATETYVQTAVRDRSSGTCIKRWEEAFIIESEALKALSLFSNAHLDKITFRANYYIARSHG